MACDSRSSWSAVLLDFLDEGTAKGPNRKVKFRRPKNPCPWTLRRGLNEPFFIAGVFWGPQKNVTFQGSGFLGTQPSTSPTSGAGYFWIPFLGELGILAPRSAPKWRIWSDIKSFQKVYNPRELISLDPWLLINLMLHFQLYSSTSAPLRDVTVVGCQQTLGGWGEIFQDWWKLWMMPNSSQFQFVLNHVKIFQDLRYFKTCPIL